MVAEPLATRQPAQGVGTKLHPSFSVYLDLLRFTAACLVFIQHATLQLNLWDLGAASTLGHEAVMFFFVLSGLVVAHTTSERNCSGRQYMIARFSRLYSVALPAALFCVALQFLSFPHRLSEIGFVVAQVGKAGLAITFLGHSLGFSNVPAWNDPFWSLYHEAWYYAIFGLAIFAPTKIRVWAIVGALLIAGISIVMLMPVWLLGVLISRRPSWTMPPWIGLLVAVAAIPPVVIISANAYDREIALWLQSTAFGSVLPGGTQFRTITDYAIGLLAALHIIGARSAAPLFGTLLLTIRRPVQWFAGATFAIYLFHFPIMMATRAGVLMPLRQLVPGAFLPAVIFVLCLLAAELTERRRDAWRALFGALFGERKAPADVVPPAAPASAPIFGGLEIMFILISIFIIFGSLYPFNFSPHANGGFYDLSEPLHAGDDIANIALFIPYGFSAVLRSDGRRRSAVLILLAVIFGEVIAAGVQIGQIFLPSRSPSLTDIITNTIGLTTGLAFGAIAASTWRRSLSPNMPAHLFLISVFFVGFQLAPFAPTLDIGLLYHNLKAVAATPIDAANVIIGAACWTGFSAILAVSLPAAKARKIILVTLPVIVAARLIMMDNLVTFAPLAGAVAGGGAALVLPLSSRRLRISLSLILLCVLVERGLFPFELRPSPASPTLIPFVDLITGNWIGNLVLLLLKCFIVAGALELLRGIWSWRAAMMLTTAVVIFIEVAQIFVASGYSSITDVVIAIAIGVIFGRMSDTRVAVRRWTLSRPAAQTSQPPRRPPPHERVRLAS